MKSNRKSALAALSGAAVVASSFFAQPAFAGGADLTCRNWHMTGQGPRGGPNILNAECRKSNGEWKWTGLWLPGVLANYNGRLARAENGFYDRSCITRGVSPTGAVMRVHADCYTPSGSLSGTYMNVSSFTNQDGNLSP